MGLFSKDVGIDLGTANTLVYMKGKGIIMREPSVVAVDTKTDEVRCVGAEAKAVIGRTPGSIVAVRPLKDGVIADFDITTNMLENFLKKACGNSMFSRPRVVICIPSGVTEVERRAVREATLKAGARQVSVIEEPMAAAIGAGLPISEPTGSMIVDIGGGTAEIAVISLGGIVASRSVRMAGDMFDQAIIAFIKRKYNLLIGERTAEQIKIEIGSAYPLDPEMTMEIKGRNLVDGLPKNIVVHSEDVREALLECLVKITSAIKETLERTPPELSADIIDHGITLTGGEPFQQPAACAELARRAHQKGLNVWSYSGYTYEKLREMARGDEAVNALLSEIDVLVDGPFLLKERSLELLYCGSKNQRIIDMKKTRETGEAVLWTPPEW